MYQVNPVDRMTGEGRAEFFRTRGPGFDQEGAFEGMGVGVTVGGGVGGARKGSCVVHI